MWTEIGILLRGTTMELSDGTAAKDVGTPPAWLPPYARRSELAAATLGDARSRFHNVYLFVRECGSDPQTRLSVVYAG
jgi:hypothetical protein